MRIVWQGTAGQQGVGERVPCLVCFSSLCGISTANERGPAGDLQPKFTFYRYVRTTTMTQPSCPPALLAGGEGWSDQAWMLLPREGGPPRRDDGDTGREMQGNASLPARTRLGGRPSRQTTRATMGSRLRPPAIGTARAHGRSEGGRQYQVTMAEGLAAKPVGE